jgi:hypothetical protein
MTKVDFVTRPKFELLVSILDLLYSSHHDKFSPSKYPLEDGNMLYSPEL